MLAIFSGVVDDAERVHEDMPEDDTLKKELFGAQVSYFQKVRDVIEAKETPATLLELQTLLEPWWKTPRTTVCFSVFLNDCFSFILYCVAGHHKSQHTYVTHHRNSQCCHRRTAHRHHTHPLQSLERNTQRNTKRFKTDHKTCL